MKMMYEQQQDVIRNKDYVIKMSRSMGSSHEEEPQLLDVLNLSGMSLESLPNPSINLAAICKLDLSNNNLQVIISLFQIILTKVTDELLLWCPFDFKFYSFRRYTVYLVHD